MDLRRLKEDPVLSEAGTYPDWKPQDSADDVTLDVTEPGASASAEVDGWGIADGAPAASAWAGFSSPANDPVAGPFWTSPSAATGSLPSWTVSADATAPPGLVDEANTTAADQSVDAVAPAFANDDYVPVAERDGERESDGDLRAFSRWDESAESSDLSTDLPTEPTEVLVAEPTEPTEVLAAEATEVLAVEEVTTPVETNRRSRLPGRRNVDRAVGPDPLDKAEAVELATMISSDETFEIETGVESSPTLGKAPKAPKAPKPPKPPKAAKVRKTIKEPVAVDELDQLVGLAEPADNAARAGFFTKKAPTTAAVDPKDAPKLLRIAALVSLIVGVALFGYTVVNNRKSTPSTPAVTIAPAPEATLVPVAPDGGISVVDPTPDPIFGDTPVAQDDGLAFDTTANFGS